jgi:hypothetical protein
MQKETKLEEILRLTLESLQKQEYSTETLLRYQKKFNALNSFAHSRGISEPSDGLFQEYLSDNKNKYTGEYSVFKDRQRIRVLTLSNLISLTVKRIRQGEKENLPMTVYRQNN